MVSRCKLKLQKRALSCLSVPNTTVPIKNIYYFQNTSNLACKGKVSIIIPFVRNAMAWQALLRNEILAEDFLYLSRVYYLLNPDCQNKRKEPFAFVGTGEYKISMAVPAAGSGKFANFRPSCSGQRRC